jgi:hypothetical protein
MSKKEKIKMNSNLLNKNIIFNKGLMDDLLICGTIIEMLFMAGIEEVTNG